MSDDARHAALIAFELELWREVSRHTDLTTFLPRLAASLNELVRVRTLAIRWIDPLAQGVETLAEVVVDDAAGQFRVTRHLTHLAASQLSALLAWCRTRR